MDWSSISSPWQKYAMQVRQLVEGWEAFDLVVKSSIQGDATVEIYLLNHHSLSAWLSPPLLLEPFVS